MNTILLVGLGGFLGSVGRWALGRWILQLTLQQHFPFATLTVNVVGCLAAGILAGLAEKHGFFGAEARLFLFTGLLGGFTTFSAFGIEAVTLVRRGDLWLAGTYAGASVVFGVAAVWIGIQVVEMLSR